MLGSFHQWDGVFAILGGTYCLLVAVGVLPRNPKDPEKQELWRRKYGLLLKVICPIVIGYGVLQVLGFFDLG